MAKDDARKERLGPSAGRRSKPPVITLEATEVAEAREVAREELARDEARPAGAEAAPDSVPPAEPASEQPSAGETPAPEAAAGPLADTPAEPAAALHDEAAAAPSPQTTAASDSDAPSAPWQAPAADRDTAAASGPGFGRLAAAGLIGALITAALAAAVQLGGLVPARESPALADLQARLASLDRTVAAVAARPVPTPPPVPAAVDLSPLNERLETLDSARKALESRLSALEQRPAATAAEPAPAVDLAPLTAEIEALKAAVARLSEAASRPPPAPDPAEIEARVQALVQPQAERLARAEGRLAALDSTQAEAAGTGRRAALLVGVDLLRSAVERGRPYAAELTAVRRLGVASDLLQPLEATAETGMATVPELARRFAPLASGIARAAPQPPAGPGLLDRLWAGAASLVRVRPVGEAAGDSAPVVVARIEARLQRGDLAGALADFDRLPEPSRAAGADWATAARARLAAEAGLRRLSAETLGALATQ